MVTFNITRSKRQFRQALEGNVNSKKLRDFINHFSELKGLAESRCLSLMTLKVLSPNRLYDMCTPAEIISYMDSISKVFTKKVIDNEGALDLIDGILNQAFFGLLPDKTSDTDQACVAALAILEKLRSPSTLPKIVPLHSLRFGIGLDKNQMVVGLRNGPQKKIMAIGEVKALSARLSGLNQFLGTGIIISQRIKSDISPDFLTRELIRIMEKGSSQPLTIHELLSGNQNQTEPDRIEIKTDYEEGLTLFYKKHFKKAAGLFKRLRQEKGDPASAFMSSQCQSLIDNPPDEYWQGEIRVF